MDLMNHVDDAQETTVVYRLQPRAERRPKWEIGLTETGTSSGRCLGLARLAIDKDFMDDYAKLGKAVQSAVKLAIDKFAEHTHAGLHLEKLHQG